MRLGIGSSFIALAFAVTTAGCPGGAVLEEPERFIQYSTGGTANAAAGSGGTAGSSAGAAGFVASCDVAVAMQGSCSRSHCHDAKTQYSGLDLSNLETMAATVVDQPATHRDFNCSPPGTAARECNAEELSARCPPGALLVDSQSFEESWIVKKLNGEQGTCGYAMPLPPGDFPTYGWSDARRICLLEYFRSLLPP